MATKYLTGDYPSGYSLSPSYRSLVVEPSAYVGGHGVTADFKASITNYGTIWGGGIYLLAGGTVTNGSADTRSAMIEQVGAIYGAASIRNFGIIDGIGLAFGGVVTNGSGGDATAQIGGIYADHATARVTNFGTIEAIDLAAGGAVSNGSTTLRKATIEGIVAHNIGITLANDGTILALSRSYIHGTEGYIPVSLGAGGVVTNGSATDTTALIQSAPYYEQPFGAGIYSKSAPTLITNFGTIEALNAQAGAAVWLEDGGSVTNGSATDDSALIGRGGNGIYAGAAPATVTNFGTIGAVDLDAGGIVDNLGVVFGVDIGSALIPGTVATIENGSATDAAAAIEYGNYGVFAGASSLVTVTNYGTIQGAIIGVDLIAGGAVMNFGTIMMRPEEQGIRLAFGGAVTNGSVSEDNAMISGGTGVYSVNATVTLTNFGTIQGARFAGVFVGAGGSITNGSATDASALLSGIYGLYATSIGATTVTNFGTISGANGYSVWLAATTDRLVAEAGSAFQGMVQGGGGTLELASGSGTLSGLGATATISGAEAMTFTGFGGYEIDAGSSWTMEGVNSVGPTQTLISMGALTIGGKATLAIAGTLDQSGTITLGDTVPGAATLSISKTGVWEIGSGSIAKGAEGGAVKVYGLLVKDAGAGVSAVSVTTYDDGVVKSTSGTLDFTNELFGTGALEIGAGAALEADRSVIDSLTVDFDGTAATLAIRFAKTFGATISGFAA